MQMMNTLKLTLQRIGKKVSWLLVAKVVAGLFVFYLLFSYFAINPLAQKLVPSIAEKSLDSVAVVDRVEFDPFRLKATVHGLKLSTKSGEVLTSFKTLVVDLELSGMFDFAWKFKQIGIIEPYANLSVASNGKLNWHGLLAKLEENPSPPSDTIPRLMIEQIIVKQGKVQYVDESRPTPISTTLTPLSFQLKGFSTLPKDRGDYFISAAFEEGGNASKGGALKWKGDMGVNPVASKGVVALEGIQIAKMLELVEGLALPIKINGGRLQASFSYNFSMPKALPTVALNNVAFAVNDVTGELAQGGTLSLNNASLNAAALDFIKTKQPSLKVKRIDFKLAGLEVKQDETMQFLLKESVANLPQIDLLAAENPQLTFQNLNLKLSNINVIKGKQLSVTLPSADVNEVSLDLAENRVNIKTVVLANLDLRKGAAESKPAESIATLKHITLTEGLVALAEQQVSVQSLVLSGLDTSVVRNADHSLNWTEMFEVKGESGQPKRVAKPEPRTVAPADSEPTKQPWALVVKKTALDNASVHIKDASTSTPVVMDIVKANIEVQDASLDMTKPLPIKASFKVKQGGRFSTQGKLWPSPLKVDLGLRLTGLSLKPFAPYVNQKALLQLNGGSAGLSGKLNLRQKRDLALTFSGGFNVKNLALIEEESGAPFLSWEALNGKQAQLAIGEDQLHVQTLELVKPSGKFIIHADKSMNLQRILRSEQKVEPAPGPSVMSVVREAGTESEQIVQFESLIKPVGLPQPAETAVKPIETATATPEMQSSGGDAFPVTIDRILLQDAQLEFADLSLITPFGTNIHSLNGAISGLATRVDKVAQVELDGVVDEYGSARIRGALQPFQATDFTDIKLAFTNLDMSKLTPYSGKFAGRRIDSGKLTVDLGYQIKQKQLVGKNKFVINKLKLGERVESSDAADLPLDLAIAILEDSDGVIDLDLPISGSLDDPEFSYSSIAWKAFKNVLTKIVTAPFRALGSIFGSGAEEFDGIAFESGVSDIAPPELEKVVKVSTALSKRKGLSLGIVPSYNVALDTQAFKEARYRQQVAEEMDIQLPEGQKPSPVDLGDERAQDALNTLYNKVTKKGFFKRMASKFDKPEDGYYEKAQAAIIASIEVTEDDLKTLAEARAQAILDALLANGIDQERLTVLKVAEVEASEQSVKTELTLKASKVTAQAITPEESQPSPTQQVEPEADDASVTPQDEAS